MPFTIVLEILEGPQKGERFHFSDADRVLVGRSRRCDVSLPNDPLHWDVSRVHCMIDVRAPHVTIRDVGSRNGTYVNDWMIGQRGGCPQADDYRAQLAPWCQLRDGDRIQVGQTVFRIEIRPGLEDADDATMLLDADAVLAGA